MYFITILYSCLGNVSKNFESKHRLYIVHIGGDFSKTWFVVCIYGFACKGERRNQFIFSLRILFIRINGMEVVEVVNSSRKILYYFNVGAGTIHEFKQN